MRGVPKVGGPARDPLLPHAYLQGGCLGVWGNRGMYVIIALSRLCQSVGKRERKTEERMHHVTTGVRSLNFWDCTGAGEELQMQDLYFATNDICTAPRLANLALKTWMV